jgi:hypothetical protein
VDHAQPSGARAEPRAFLTQMRAIGWSLLAEISGRMIAMAQ